MSKVLLVYEDYTTMTNTESALIKAGFDVIGATNEFSLSERVLAFNPEIVIGFGKSGKVSTMGVGKKLKDMTRWQGKVILIMPVGVRPPPAELIKIRVDVILEAPVSMIQLLGVLAKLTGQDENFLIEKFQKSKVDLGPRQTSQGGTRISGGSSSAVDNSPIHVTGSVGRDQSFKVLGSASDTNEVGEIKNFSQPNLMDRSLTQTQTQKQKTQGSLGASSLSQNPESASGFDAVPSDDLNPENDSDSNQSTREKAQQDLRARSSQESSGSTKSSAAIAGLGQVDSEMSSLRLSTGLSSESSEVEGRRNLGDKSDQGEIQRTKKTQKNEVEEPSSFERSIAQTSNQPLADREKAALGSPPADFDMNSYVEPGSDEEDMLKENIRLSVEKAKNGLSEKVAQYAEKLQKVDLPKSTQMTRVEAKKRQKLLSQDWKKEDLEDQDSLRRNFTASLFKKR